VQPSAFPPLSSTPEDQAYEAIHRLQSKSHDRELSLEEKIELDRHEKTVAAADKKRLEAEQQALRAGNPPGELPPYQQEALAEAGRKLGEGKDASAARGTDGRAPEGAVPDRAGSPGGNDPRGVELPGGRRNGGGGSPDSNLVLAGGGDGGHQPLQGGAAAEVPPSVSAGGQLPDAVGQMMSRPTGAGDTDAPRASAGGEMEPEPRPHEVRHSKSEKSTSSINESAEINRDAISGGNLSSSNKGSSPEVQWIVPEKPHHIKPTLSYDADRPPSGPPKKVSKNDRDPDNIRACDAENEAAGVFSKYGYDYARIRETRSSPDGLVKGVQGKWDVYAPRSATPLSSIHAVAARKVNVQNAPYVVVRLEADGQSIADISKHFKDNPIPGLKQLFVVKNGELYVIY